MDRDGVIAVTVSHVQVAGDETDDVQDLVDHMNQMVTSGRIDNSAYLGEPNHDEEDDRYVPTVKPEDSPGTVGDGEG